MYNTEVIKLCGLKKSQIIDALNKVTTNATAFGVEENCLDACVELTCVGDEQVFDSEYRKVLKVFKDNVYSLTDRALNQVVFDYLKTGKHKLLMAESLTGGELASSMVSLAGISDYFVESVVCYSYESKILRLGVLPETLNEYSAVSKQVAEQMITGLFRCGLSGDVGVITTGNAGPTGDGAYPVGTVYIGVGTPDYHIVFSHRFDGDRDTVRKTSVNMALFYLVRLMRGAILTLPRKNNVVV